MTIINKLLAVCTTAVALVIASSSTAQADPRAAANIPGADTKIAAAEPNGADTQIAATEPNATDPQIAATEPNATDPKVATTSDELPLPYVAWQGTGPPPPTAAQSADLPPPLARARQLPRRPFEVAASLAAFLPSCGTGSVDDRGCLTVSPGSGVDVALLYRVGPFFAVGGEAVVSGFAARGAGPLSGAGGGARFFGVVGRVYFADDGAWDPYLALTLGAGTLRLGGDEDARVSTSGLGGRVAGGIDYVFGTHFRLGPTASFAHWLAWSEQSCSANVCRDQPAVYGRLLGFATVGFRLTASFGDVL